MQSVSTHAPLAGSDGHLVVDRHSVALFQPTLPLRGATVVLGLDSRGLWFQPTLPLRGATRPLGFFARLPRFNPRSPCGERRWEALTNRCKNLCFNPRSPCGERLFFDRRRPWRKRFNPRSPCGERPPCNNHRSPRPCFNPRSPCGERHIGDASKLGNAQFQPTLPLRGATWPRWAARAASRFNPRSPCGERRSAQQIAAGAGRVSTHAPLAGSDVMKPYSTSCPSCFNPRSPCGERPSPAAGRSPAAGFNPRSPCGERPLHLVNVALRAYHMHDVFHPNASSDELRPSETNQKAVRTSQGIPDSPQFAPPIIPTAYS